VHTLPQWYDPIHTTLNLRPNKHLSQHRCGRFYPPLYRRGWHLILLILKKYFKPLIINNNKRSHFYPYFSTRAYPKHPLLNSNPSNSTSTALCSIWQVSIPDFRSGLCTIPPVGVLAHAPPIDGPWEALRGLRSEVNVGLNPMDSNHLYPTQRWAQTLCESAAVWAQIRPVFRPV
jgi:hypothetical protein